MNFTPPDSPLNTSSSSYMERHDHEEIGLSTPHRDNDDEDMMEGTVLSTPVKDTVDFSVHSLPANLFCSPPKTHQQQPYHHTNNVQQRFFGEELTPVTRNVTDHHFQSQGMTQTDNNNNNNNNNHNMSMLVSPEEADNTLLEEVDLSLPTASSNTAHDRPYFVTPNLKSKRQFHFRSMRGADTTTTMPTLGFFRNSNSAVYV